MPLVRRKRNRDEPNHCHQSCLRTHFDRTVRFKCLDMSNPSVRDKSFQDFSEMVPIDSGQEVKCTTPKKQLERK